MLVFGSGNSAQVNSSTALKECIEKAAGDDPSDIDVLLISSTVGHNFKALLAAAKECCPDAAVVGCTGTGVIYSYGVSESMRALAVLTIGGPEVCVAFRDGLTRANGRDLAADAARELAGALDGINAIMLFSAGFDVTGDHLIAGVEEVFGPDVPIFGGIAADNGKALSSFQFHGDTVTEHGLFMVALADPSLAYEWVSHHGSTPAGEPFTVTRAEDGHILELDGEPAWSRVMARLGLPEDTPTGETLPIAGMGFELPADEQGEYDNSHILRVPLETDGNGGFYFPAGVP